MPFVGVDSPVEVAVPVVVSPALKTPDLFAPGLLVAPPPGATLPASSRTPPSNLAIGLIAGAALLVLVSLGVVIGIAAITSAVNGAEDSYSNVTESDDESGDDGAIAGSDLDSSPSDETTPEPTVEAAEPTQSFASVSGNITCSISPDAVLCHQGNVKYVPPSSSCVTALGGATVGLDHDSAIWPCLDSSISDPVPVNYDAPVSAYGFTCTINYESGVTCVNGRGSGFIMEYTNGIETF